MSASHVIFDEATKTVYIFGTVTVETPATWKRVYGSDLGAPVRVALALFDASMATANACTDKKIAAIKVIRRVSGTGLREAKEAYEFVERLSLSCTRALCHILFTVEGAQL